MGLLDLPNEILFVIARLLKYDWNISVLSQVNSSLYLLLNRYLYQHNQRYFQGSLLTWAATKGSQIVARKMLDAGADPLANNESWLALSLAVENGHAAIIQLFVEQGTVIPAKNFLTSYQPLYAAATLGHLSVVRLIIARGELPEPDTIKRTLTDTAEEGHFAVIKILVEGILDQDCEDYYGFLTSGLRSASARNHIEIVQYLLQRISPYNVYFTLNDSLFAAAREGNLEILRYLLAY